MDQVTKKYQEIDDILVLFNDEYYLSVEKIDITLLSTAQREALFNHLYDFENKDMELEIDVTEEEKGVWYLQLLVPHVFTLPEAAKRRIEKGREVLTTHLLERCMSVNRNQLQRDEIFEYVKRYNPGLERIP